MDKLNEESEKAHELLPHNLWLMWWLINTCFISSLGNMVDGVAYGCKRCCLRCHSLAGSSAGAYTYGWTWLSGSGTLFAFLMI